MKITNITNLKGKVSKQLRISLAKKSGVTINVILNPGDFIFAENIYNNNILRIYEKKKFLVLEDEKPLEEQEFYLVYNSNKSKKLTEDTLKEEVLVEKAEVNIEVESNIKNETNIETEVEIQIDNKVIEEIKVESEIELEGNIEEDEIIEIEVIVPEDSLTKNKGGRPKGSKNKSKRGRPKIKKPTGRPRKNKK